MSSFAPNVTRAGFAAFLLASLVAAGSSSPALAGSTIVCSYDAEKHKVTVTGESSGGQVSIHREGDEIRVSGFDCGDATRFNTDHIMVTDSAGNNLEGFVSLHGGRLQPGFTDEPGRSDEIEIVFNFVDGSDLFDAHMTDQEDNVRVGLAEPRPGIFQRRLNLNANEGTGIDHDVTVRGTSGSLIVEGFGGDDVLDAGGGAGTGEPYPHQLYLSGYDNRDTLTGGLGVNSIDGDGGADVLMGGPGVDDLEGGTGEDIVKGGDGADLIEGEGGFDDLYGGKGADDLGGGAGNDDHFGGDGTDTCIDEFGDNTFVSCEKVSKP